MTRKIRPYQDNWLDAVTSRYAAGITRQLGRAATGLGKTVFFANLPGKLKLSRRMLVVSHREELATQAADKIKVWNPDLSVGVEMGDYRSKSSDQIVSAGVATIGRSNSNRLKQFDPRDFGVIVIDEAHHATASSYRTILEYFGAFDRKDLLLLGVTATPNRADGRGLNEIFQELVFDMPLVQGIKEGWLANLRGMRVSTKANLDAVHTVAGDFNTGELSREINTPARNDLIVRNWLERCENRQTVAFTTDIQHAKDLAAAFGGYGVVAQAIWGDDPARREKLQAHKLGQIKVLTNCQILTEGYDDPGVACIIPARPTQSSTLYEQIIGRGTRIPPDIGNLLEAKRRGITPSKEDCIVLDVVDVSRRHSLNNIATLFGLPEKLDFKGATALDVVEKVEELEKKKPGTDLSTLTDFSRIQSFVEEIDLFKVEYPPEIIQISDFTWHRSKYGSYVLLLANNEEVVVWQNHTGGRWRVVGVVNGSQFQRETETFENAIRDADQLVKTLGGRATVSMIARSKKSWHVEPATDGQKSMLRMFKLPVPEGLTKGQARDVINREIAKRKGAKK